MIPNIYDMRFFYTHNIYGDHFVRLEAEDMLHHGSAIQNEN
jgi:hypothetical protein